VSETRIHPETGKVLRRDVRPQTIVVGTLSRTLDVPGWYPDDDGDAVHSGVDLKEMDDVYKALREQYAARVRSVRKKLGLTQEEAGLIIGGGKRAFQKYESGRMPPSDAAVGLIEVLARHPEEVALLRSFRPSAAKEKREGRKARASGGRIAASRTKRGVRTALA
jgi:HTH-type transcriptional regulator/antitoxin MqsA